MQTRQRDKKEGNGKEEKEERKEGRKLKRKQKTPKKNKTGAMCEAQTHMSLRQSTEGEDFQGVVLTGQLFKQN